MNCNSPSFRLTSLRLASSGIVGDFDIEDVTTVRAVVEQAQAGNTFVFSGKIKGQTNFVVIETFTGSFNQLIEVDTYDTFRIECTVYSSSSDHITLSAAGYTPELRIVDIVSQLINDSIISTNTTWSSDKINSSILDLGDRYVRTSRFEIISSGTTGSVTIPIEQSIILDDFGGTTDAVITTVTAGRPTNYPAQTISGQIVATTFDSMGNWTISATPSSYPIAIIYRTRQKLSTYIDTDANIVGNPQYDEVRSVNGKTGDVVLDALDVGALDAVNALTVELEWDQLYPSFYTEPSYDINDRITQVDIWDTPSKVIPLFTKVYSYSGPQLTSVTVTHLTDGATLVKNFTYNLSGFITNITRTYTP